MAAGVNGFCKNGVTGSKVTVRAIASGLYPEMNSTFMSGLASRSL